VEEARPSEGGREGGEGGEGEREGGRERRKNQKRIVFVVGGREGGREGGHLRTIKDLPELGAIEEGSVREAPQHKHVSP
jgi:hypothetical protein